jgi:LytS/YehU family sensor histidine kinase
MIKSEKTPEMILKLSDMLRYILYDCQEEQVSLQKEIDYIRNYIDLQKLKDEHFKNIDIAISADGHRKVAPMLLIPFIENAFKHGDVLLTEEGWIKIYLSTDRGQLQFSIQNSIPDREYTKDKSGGIGLENVKKRLDMLYKDAYELKIDQNEKVFRVDLNILL